MQPAFGAIQLVVDSVFCAAMELIVRNSDTTAGTTFVLDEEQLSVLGRNPEILAR
jgi:hypothetical protein